MGVRRHFRVCSGNSSGTGRRAAGRDSDTAAGDKTHQRRRIIDYCLMEQLLEARHCRLARTPHTGHSSNWLLVTTWTSSIGLLDVHVVTERHSCNVAAAS